MSRPLIKDCEVKSTGVAQGIMARIGGRSIRPSCPRPDDARGVAARRRLFERARKHYGEVNPCAGRNWEGCLTRERGLLLFWFNTADGNTHVEKEEETQ